MWYRLLQASNCNKCKNGSSNDANRCRESGNKPNHSGFQFINALIGSFRKLWYLTISGHGIICNVAEGTDEIEEEFVFEARFCDGDRRCKNMEDETDCENGFYCNDQSTFVPWVTSTPHLPLVNTLTVAEICFVFVTTRIPLLALKAKLSCSMDSVK